MKRLLRISAAAATALSLGGGVVAAQTGTIGTTGPDSRNTIEFRDRSSMRVRNNNNVAATNNNPQVAETGNARVRHNTTGGDAMSGEASNDSLLSASVSLNNGGAGSGGSSSSAGGSSASIDNTGPNSHNRVTFNNSHETSVQNNNNVSITNNNDQYAGSGNARVSGNTTGGSAHSGDASNISTTDLTIEVNN